MDDFVLKCMPPDHDEEDVQAFKEWAFGKNIDDLPSLEIMEAWNALHRDIYLLKIGSNILVDLVRMVDLFLEQSLFEQTGGRHGSNHHSKTHEDVLPVIPPPTTPPHRQLILDHEFKYVKDCSGINEDLLGKE